MIVYIVLLSSFNCVTVPKADVTLILWRGGWGRGSVGGHDKYGNGISHFPFPFPRVNSSRNASSCVAPAVKFNVKATVIWSKYWQEEEIKEGKEEEEEER